MRNFGNYLESKRIVSINFDTNNKLDVSKVFELDDIFTFVDDITAFER